MCRPVLQGPVNCKVIPCHNILGGTCSLTRVESSQATKLLLFKQVHGQLLQEMLPWKTLERLCATNRGGDGYKVARDICKKKLQQLGAVAPKGQKPLLVTVANVIRGLKTARFDDGDISGVLQSLQALHTASGGQMALHTHAASQQNAVGSVSPTTFEFAASLPTVLPQNAPKLSRAQRFSLKPAKAAAAVLRMQMTNLRDHSKQPIVIGREGGPISSDTWMGVHKECMLYLGYINSFCSIGNPTLEHFTRAELFIMYIASKHARGDAATTISKVIGVARRVVFFWKLQSQDEAQGHKLMAVHAWMGKVAAQIRLSSPWKKRDVQDMKDKGTWQDAAQIVSLLESAKSDVLSTCSAGPLTLEQARQLHDITVVCCMFGWLPPLRSSCIRTLVTPSHDGPCSHADCTSDDCRGNRLLINEAQQLAIHLPHHKSAKRWPPIQYVLPLSLASLVLLYLRWGHSVLADDMDVQHGHAFMSRKGKPFTSSNFSSFAKGVLVDLGGPNMPPHTLRHVYVCDRMAEAIVGPSRDGEAYCMGHHSDQWEESYDLQSLQRQGQAAVDAMDGWRANLLTRLHAQQPDVQAAPTSPVAVNQERDCCCSSGSVARHEYSP